MSESAHLLIADDHPLFRGALREAVAGMIPGARIAEAGSFEETVKLLDRQAEMDLVLLDLSMPGIRGFSAKREAARVFFRDNLPTSKLARA